MSGVNQPSDKTLVIIPTYNELENLPLIVERVHQATPDVDILIADDGSPDGTGEAADKLAAARQDAAERGRIHVMHRTAKNGLGAAYLAGFAWGLERGYEVLVEMDADGSHAPEQLHQLLTLIDDGTDLAIGSRYVRGGRTVNWPKRRAFLSWGANTYARLALGAKIHDITAGYRAYRAQLLRDIGLDSVESQGYCFQIDMSWRAVQLGATVRETPITFTERAIGESKMDGAVITEAFTKVAKWGFEGRTAALRRRFAR